MKNFTLQTIAIVLTLLIPASLSAQNQRPQLYASTNVQAHTEMQVSVSGSKTDQGNIVVVQLNGRTLAVSTDMNGQAVLDLSGIAKGLTSRRAAIVRFYDKDGEPLGAVYSMVLPANSRGRVQKPNYMSVARRF